MLKKLAIASLAILLLGGLPANAHSQLIDVNPRPNSVQKTSLSKITLTFNEDLIDLGGSSNAISLTTTSNRRIATEPVQIVSNELRTKVKARLAPGNYFLWWRAVSADGHPISGKYRFRVSR